MPAVVITSEDFEEFALSSAQALGLPEARILIVPHPIGGVPDEVLRERAEARAEQVMSLFQAQESTENGA